MKRFEDELEQIEASLFTGRTLEQQRYQSLLYDDHEERILHLVGVGGVGKSWLLRQYQRITLQDNALFILIDFQNMVPTPEGFVQSFHDKFIADGKNPIDWLNELSTDSKVVLALDSYEKAIGFDQWFRESFLSQLNRQILIVIAGRCALGGGWMQSTAWKRMIAWQKLLPFSEEEIIDYFDKNELPDGDLRKQAAVWSGGLPVMLSMCVASQSFPDITGLSEQWLLETSDESLWQLAQHASLLRSFDQEVLQIIAGETIEDTLFQQLTHLSLVESGKLGWYIHDLARESIQALFRKRKPTAYQACRQRCIKYYSDILIQDRNNNNTIQTLQELIFHTSDSMLRSVLPISSVSSRNLLETLTEHNYSEVEAYLNRRKLASKHKVNRYVDYESDSIHTLELTEEQDYIRGKLVDPADWLALGLESAKLLRDANGEMIGLFVAIPIHRHTLDLLSSRPVTRAYFRTLNRKERLALEVSPQSPAGWYIRMIDVADPNDGRSRSELMHMAIDYFVSGGLILFSTHIAFYHALLDQLGFVTVSGADHEDYGKGVIASTYALDLRGDGLKNYVHRLSSLHDGKSGQEGGSMPFSFTDRELNIIRLILMGKSNPQIAEALYLSEITIKKYVSQILRKTSTQNRSMLVKALVQYEQYL